MITTKDIAKLAQVFATKEEFFSFKKDVFDLEDKITKLITDFRNENLKAMSDIVGELQTIREEQLTGGYRQTLHSDQLEDHEARLTTLENPSKLAPV